MVILVSNFILQQKDEIKSAFIDLKFFTKLVSFLHYDT